MKYEIAFETSRQTSGPLHVKQCNVSQQNINRAKHSLEKKKHEDKKYKLQICSFPFTLCELRLQQFRLPCKTNLRSRALDKFLPRRSQQDQRFFGDFQDGMKEINQKLSFYRIVPTLLIVAN